MVAIHSSSHIAFNSINDLHWKKVITLIKYSWHIESTHELINSWYFQHCLNIFDYCNKNIRHVCRVTNEFEDLTCQE